MNSPLPTPTPENRYDFGELLKQNPGLCRILRIDQVSLPHYLKLELVLWLSFSGPPWPRVLPFKLVSINTVDYAVRPRRPEVLGGGPLVEYYEEHPRLQVISQCVPHSDGLEHFDPPVKFKLLVLEDTYIIAGHFEMVTDGREKLPAK